MIFRKRFSFSFNAVKGLGFSKFSAERAPEGLVYVSSWVDNKLEHCYQLMETRSPKLLDEWMANWKDLVDFEVYPVITSAEAAEKISSRL